MLRRAIARRSVRPAINNLSGCEESKVETPQTSQRFCTNLAALGSLVVSIACLWALCALHPSKGANLEIAFLYVLLSSALGALSFWLFAPGMGRAFAVRTTRLASSWILVPPMVLLFRADSVLCVCAGILVGATFVLALIERQDSRGCASSSRGDSLQFQLFQTEAFSVLPPWTTLLLSFLLFATAFAVARMWLLPAVVSAAISAGIAAFRWTSLNEENPVSEDSMAHHAKRSGMIAVTSIVITSMLLVPQQVKVAQAEDLRAMQALLQALDGTAYHSRGHAAHAALQAEIAGVPRVFLWPKLPRKIHVLVAPPIVDEARVIRRSLDIPFDGPYIYTEQLDVGRKTKPLTAHGTPLKVKISSIDGNPISMEARQRLAPPIDLASCRAIQVTIKTVRPQVVIGLGMTLANTSVPHTPQLSLAEQPLKADMASKSAVGEQTQTFPIPASTRLQAFNQIIIQVIRTPMTTERGARIAIERFILLPR